MKNFQLPNCCMVNLLSFWLCNGGFILWCLNIMRILIRIFAISKGVLLVDHENKRSVVHMTLVFYTFIF